MTGSSGVIMDEQEMSRGPRYNGYYRIHNTVHQQQVPRRSGLRAGARGCGGASFIIGREGAWCMVWALVEEQFTGRE
jgi:hypothetical protein